MPKAEHKPVIVKDLTEFQIPSNYHLHITGTNSGSDVLWNYFRGRLELRDEKNRIRAAVNVADFTRNCGVKSISKLSINHNIDPKAWWAMVTSLLHNHARAGILVASDSTAGYTYQWLKQFGFELTEPVWNPVYTWARDHKISVGYLFLKDIPSTSLWKQLPLHFNEVI